LGASSSTVERLLVLDRMFPSSSIFESRAKRDGKAEEMTHMEQSARDVSIVCKSRSRGDASGRNTFRLPRQS
jgi:hypothetical protein